jgi:hypothetical protein
MLGGDEKEKPPLSVAQILEWADAHYARKGFYPRKDAGAVAGAPGESWNRIDTALRFGYRSLAGGTTLRQLLARHRGRAKGNRLPEVTVADILAWAEAFRQAKGQWPNEASGPVQGAPAAITWHTIGQCLRTGGQGLPGGTTLRRLLAQHRGAPGGDRPPRLTIEQVLAWADSYHAAHGCWPNKLAGRVAASRQETWGGIDRALRQGRRGLPAGSSLGALLAEHRGARKRPPDRTLTVAQILAWADAHHAATGVWPTTCSGPVLAAPGRDWSTIDHVLRKARHGFPRGSSLHRLLSDNGRFDRGLR